MKHITFWCIKNRSRKKNLNIGCTRFTSLFLFITEIMFAFLPDLDNLFLYKLDTSIDIGVFLSRFRIRQLFSKNLKPTQKKWIIFLVRARFWDHKLISFLSSKKGLNFPPKKRGHVKKVLKELDFNFVFHTMERIYEFF